MDSFHIYLEIEPLTKFLRSKQLNWCQHDTLIANWINQCLNLVVVGNCGKDWPQKSWEDISQDTLKVTSAKKLFFVIE